MPRMNAEERQALIDVVMRKREAGSTFDQIASELGLANRQAARLLYRAGFQKRSDRFAYECASTGNPLHASMTISKAMARKIERDFGLYVIEGWKEMQARRSAGDGSEQEAV